VHWPLMGGLLHLVQFTLLLYDVPLLCGFNVAIKGLISTACTGNYSATSNNIMVGWLVGV